MLKKPSGVRTTILKSGERWYAMVFDLTVAGEHTVPEGAYFFDFFESEEGAQAWARMGGTRAILEARWKRAFEIGIFPEGSEEFLKKWAADRATDQMLDDPDTAVAKILKDVYGL